MVNWEEICTPEDEARFICRTLSGRDVPGDTDLLEALQNAVKKFGYQKVEQAMAAYRLDCRFEAVRRTVECRG